MAERLAIESYAAQHGQSIKDAIADAICTVLARQPADALSEIAEELYQRHGPKSAASAERMAMLEEQNRVLREGDKGGRARTKSISRALAEVSRIQVAESSVELEKHLASLFAATDTDGNGVLSISELTALLRKADLGLQADDIHFMIANADANHDGEVCRNDEGPVRSRAC